jgi:hypothetical protein
VIPLLESSAQNAKRTTASAFPITTIRRMSYAHLASMDLISKKEKNALNVLQEPILTTTLLLNLPSATPMVLFPMDAHPKPSASNLDPNTSASSSRTALPPLPNSSTTSPLLNALNAQRDIT